MTQADNTQKDGFILYRSHYESISQLTDEQLGRLLRLLFQWQIEGKAEKDPEGVVNMAASFIINQFKVDRAKYQERCSKNRDAAIARWGKDKNANAYKRIQTHTSGCNTMPNENENVNENVNVSSSRKSGGKSLPLPYPDNIEFVNTWNELRQQPKWRKKTVTALQKSLNQLGPYPVEFVIELMNDAIAGGYQGVVFADTPERFRKWQQSHQNKQPGKTAPDYGGCLVV